MAVLNYEGLRYLSDQLIQRFASNDTVNAHLSNKSNPHEVTVIEEGKGNVVSSFENGEQIIAHKDIHGISQKEGNIVQENCLEDMSIRVKTTFEPIQSGSGDPYPAGGGRNLLPYPYYTSSGNINGITYNTESDGSITANGTPTDTSKYSIYYLFPGKYTESKSMFSLPAGDWVLCSEGAADNSKMYPVVNERISDSEYKTLASGTKKNQAPFTLNEAKTNLYMSLVCVPGYAPNNETVKIGIVKNGDSTAWQPYSNIRPISGRETVNLNHTDAHYAGWKDIIADINNGLGAAKYPVGTKFVIPHSVYGERLFEVVAHDYLKAVGDDGKHTMTIQQHDLLPTTQFDASEAFYYAEAELPAGTYNFTLATAYNSWAEGTYQFTLTQAVPAGGQLAISGYADAAMTALQVHAYTNQTTTTATESVAITAGSGGTNLGTFGEGLNHSHRVSFGSNNYKESAIRQFLNSSDAAGSVWTPQTKFDRPPSWLTSLAGYKNGLGQDFLAVVGKVVLPCSANDTYEAPDSSIAKGTKYTLNDEFYLASRAEIFGSHDVDDGTVLFPFYEGAGNADRIKYRDGSAAPWWLRTPYSGHAHNVRRVNSDGTVGNHNARHSIGLAPACTIYDTGIVPNGAVRIIAKDEEFTVENKQTYTAQLGQTVYGGTVDWSKGVLTVDWASVEFNGETDNGTWHYSTDTNRVYFRDASQKMPIGLHLNSAVGFYLSDRYKPMEKYHSDEGHQFELGFVDEAIHGVAFWDSINGTGVNEWKSYLAAQYAAGTPVQIAYKLAEPYTIQLSPIQIQSLKGKNTISSENGFSSVIFNADSLNCDITPISVEQTGDAVAVENGIDGYGFKATSIIEPIQPGSGDPYPAGGGKNLLQNTATTNTNKGVTFSVNADGSVTINGTATGGQAQFRLAGSYSGTESVFEYKAGVTYVLSTHATGYGIFALYSRQTGEWEQVVQISSSSGLFKPTEDGYVTDICLFLRTNTTVNNVTVYPQIEIGTAPTDYAPYSNIRSISGYDAVELNHAGKNLLQNTATTRTINGVTFTVNADESVTLNGTATSLAFFAVGAIQLKAGTSYIVNGCPTGGSDDSYSFTLRSDSWSSAPQYGTDKGKGTVIKLDKNTTVYSLIRVAAGATVNNLTFYPMIRLASVANPAYEPYQGDTYTVQIGQTVYGGTVDWNTGILTVDRKQGTITSLTGNFDSSGILAIAQQVSDIEPVNDGTIAANIISDCLPTYSLSIARREAVANAIVLFGNYLYIKIKGCSTAEDYQDWIANNPITYVYKLAEPYTIQLTPQHLTMFQGENNFSSNSTALKIKTNTSIITNEVIGRLKVLSYGNTEEGGGIQLQAPETQKNINSIVLDNRNGAFRIFGNPSADGTTKTGNGSIFSIDPYAKTITADSYTFSGTAQKAATLFVSIEEPSSEQYFYPIFITNKNQNYYAPKVSSGFQFYTKTGTTSVVGLAQIGAGNNIKSDTIGNMAGALYLYGTGSGYTYLKPSNNTDSNYEVLLPTASGTLALTSSDITGNAATATKATQDANGDTITTSYLRRYDWWTTGGGNDVDALRAGITFAYANYHNAPVTGTIVAFDSRRNEKYGLQIMGAYSNYENHLHFRNCDGDSNEWGAWRTVLDNNNYTTYTVTKTGSGASGTWDISITGSSTKLATARTITTNLASTSAASFDGSDNITPGVTGTLGLGNGGTGATTASGVLTNLGIIISNTQPSSPTEGMIWLKI